jgi:hypothetical protein
MTTIYFTSFPQLDISIKFKGVLILKKNKVSFLKCPFNLYQKKNQEILCFFSQKFKQINSQNNLF